MASIRKDADLLGAPHLHELRHRLLPEQLPLTVRVYHTLQDTSVKKRVDLTWVAPVGAYWRRPIEPHPRARPLTSSIYTLATLLACAHVFPPLALVFAVSLVARQQIACHVRVLH
eukprot:3492895-Pleurochrysis_carterae.AAC.2